MRTRHFANALAQTAPGHPLYDLRRASNESDRQTERERLQSRLLASIPGLELAHIREIIA